MSKSTSKALIQKIAAKWGCQIETGAPEMIKSKIRDPQLAEEFTEKACAVTKAVGKTRITKKLVEVL